MTLNWAEGQSPLNVFILQNVVIFLHLTARVHPTLYSVGYAQGQEQIRSAYYSYKQEDCLGK